MRVAAVGDTHGNWHWLTNYVMPRLRGCTVVQLGDFGVYWPESNGDEDLDLLQRACTEHDVNLVFLPGNHENHPVLQDMTKMWDQNKDGHYILRPRIAYTGRVSAWTWDGKRYAAVGGGASIDKQWRVARQIAGGPQQWWPEEILTPDEIQYALGLPQVDTLFTHDAPTGISQQMELLPHLESLANRQLMDRIGRALTPTRWYHGHYHYRCDYLFHHSKVLPCNVVGLDCDATPWQLSIETVSG